MAIKLSQLHFAAVPASAQAASVDAEVSLSRSILRVDQRLALVEAWRGRIVLRPVPTPRASLQDLVQVARRRLRDDRVAADTEELSSRRELLSRIKTAVES